ncbi:DNA-directed RNA polymerases I, II, and III subunit RPABC3 [Malassezia cuniculi]|uniref:DNA-directed RNA polymerases I, II, and III subunit RPABC3 n=1 Tax=Malassezia cuniculi TaxID=948313 RepID=A0AAF0EV44_9BASI|nr:DNA-directed RNA polymerases I, II, and III subunit RPABC3 [Malassezia cuniculi]
MSANSLFDTQFNVTQIDPDGKKFDRVSRIIAHSPTLDMTLSVDIATDIYPVTVGQQLTFQLVSSLHRQKAGDEASDRESWRLDQPGAQGIAEEYDYVMYGKIFKYDERSAEQVTVYASFGGLLMALTGSFRHLSKLTVGANVYLLIR